jgi:cytoskeletal protein CcmA (bactofilin family)
MSHQNGSSDKRTVVDEGTSFKGTLSSSCPIDVRGRIEGDVETPSLTISQSGAVHGRVKVGSVRSDGEIAGEFDADHVELAGSVKDNTVIRARSLEVRLATERGRQVIFGECELSVGDEPTEHIDLPVPVERALSVAAPPGDAPVEAPVAAVTSADDPANSDITQARDDETVGAPVAVAAAPPTEASDEEDDNGEDEDEDDPTASAAPAETIARKRRRGRKSKNSQNGQVDDPPLTGWSQPPSQPPPAS